MVTNTNGVSSIEFNQDWFCYYQPSTDRTDSKTIVANGNNNHWSKTQLPHHLTTKEKEKINHSKPFRWWYCKYFDWCVSRNQQICLIFDPCNRPNQSSNIEATIWLNTIEIFQGSLLSLRDSIELSPHHLRNNENPMNQETFANCLVICCYNMHLYLDAYVFIQGDLVCATGQVQLCDLPSDSNEKHNEVLDYTASMGDTDGLISVNFNAEQISRRTSIKSITSARPVVDEKRMSRNNSGNLDDDLLVPRLAIVILIVGTRGDVQPFIALGQALRAAGHRVRLATHATFRSFVRGNGLEFYPLAGDPADLMAFMVKNAGIIPSMSSIIEGDIKKKRRILADIIASTWQACIAPDDEMNAPFTAEAIIANPPSFGHIHCAEKLKIPLHVMFTMPWTPTKAFPHPLSNIDGSVGPTETINCYSYDVIEMLTWTGIRDIVNDFREKTLHLSPLNNRQAIHALIDDRVPHTYCWSPSLVAQPHDWEAHINVSGFFFLDLGTTYDHPPKDLLEFLDIDEHGNKRGVLSAPIYIGFGSITGHDSRRILAVVLDALKETEHRALLSGLASENDKLPPNVFRIGNVPHDWLFQYVSAVCHHGGAGTTAAGLRAGKPTIIVPFFGDQFFWGRVIEKNGAGSRPLPGKSITAKKLADAFHFVHKPSTKEAAERLRAAILRENGCLEAVRAFHANLPLKRLHSDLEPTFAACFYLSKYNLQISRPVAQVLVSAGGLDESELQTHTTREWQFMHDDRRHFFMSGIIEHSQKAFTSMITDTAQDLERDAHNKNTALRTVQGAGCIARGVGLGIGHLSIGCLSLYGELSDGLDLLTTLYDPYSNPKARPRPRVTDFKSGAKAAGLALWNGWKDGFTGIFTQPKVGYKRHGALGGVAATLIATVNLGLKPSIGTMSSLTWLGRGTYASVKKAVETYGREGRRIPPGLFDAASTASDESSKEHEDDYSISPAIKKAAALSGLHPRVCQYIVDEFEKVKTEWEAKQSSTVSKKNPIRDFFTKKKIVDSSHYSANMSVLRECIY